MTARGPELHPEAWAAADQLSRPERLCHWDQWSPAGYGRKSGR